MVVEVPVSLATRKDKLHIIELSVQLGQREVFEIFIHNIGDIKLSKKVVFYLVDRIRRCIKWIA